MIDNSRSSSLFSTTSFTTELLIPSVAIDLSIVVKLRKLPIIAIPEEPRKTAIILDENKPKTKLTITEMEFRDKTLSKALFWKFLNTITFLLLWQDCLLQWHFRV